MKTCAHCKESKTLDKFGNNKRFPDGKSNYCKSCKKAADFAYKSKHRKRLVEYSRQYVLAHPEQTRQYFQQHYLKNREFNLAYKREHYRNNKEKFLAYAKHRKELLKRGGAWFTEDEWNDLLDLCGHRCAACRATDVKLTVDHIVPVSKGGRNSIDNIQPLCLNCNKRKFTKHIDYRPHPDIRQFINVPPSLP